MLTAALYIFLNALYIFLTYPWMHIMCFETFFVNGLWCCYNYREWLIIVLYIFSEHLLHISGYILSNCLRYQDTYSYTFHPVVPAYLWMYIMALYRSSNAYYISCACLWMSISALHIPLNVYCVFCAYFWIPVVALYISVSICRCLIHSHEWPIHKKNSLNHIFFTSISS